MRVLFDPLREQDIKLEKFRESFRMLTSDGQYPPDRLQRLFQACRTIGLDWNKAQQHVLPDAVTLLKKMVERMIADGRITAQEIANLRRMQRRLAVHESYMEAAFEQLFDIVEQRLFATIIDQAAYLSDPVVVEELKRGLAEYNLPLPRTQRMTAQLNRQHDLAKMMVGNLPVVMPSVGLFHDEICHLDAPTTVLTTDPGQALDGRLVITSRRLMVLSSTGGMTIGWPQCRAVESADRSLVLVSTVQSAMFICDDPQYVATLIAAARRHYVPQAAPEPLRPGRRL